MFEYDLNVILKAAQPHQPRPKDAPRPDRTRRWQTDCLMSGAPLPCLPDPQAERRLLPHLSPEPGDMPKVIRPVQQSDNVMRALVVRDRRVEDPEEPRPNSRARLPPEVRLLTARRLQDLARARAS